jgi:hypothetical protein
MSRETYPRRIKMGIMKAVNYRGDLKAFLKKYSYLPELTDKLDRLDNSPFSQPVINEIVLWKINRYVSIPKKVQDMIEQVRKPRKGQHRVGEVVLKALLGIRGVDLRMASTLLRFRNPKTFQIIDQRAYRAIYGENYRLYSTSAINKKIETYFEYLDNLIQLCKEENLNFRKIDRLLYQFDKEKNLKLKQ